MVFPRPRAGLCLGADPPPVDPALAMRVNMAAEVKWSLCSKLGRMRSMLLLARSKLVRERSMLGRGLMDILLSEPAVVEYRRISADRRFSVDNLFSAMAG